MARINRAPSSTPARESSAFPGRTPGTARRPNGYHASGTPEGSDKENQTMPATDKGKERMGPPGKLPTPNSDSSDVRSAKRRRTSEQVTPLAGRNVQAESIHSQYYDPNQDESERREVKRQSRTLERLFNENRDDYLKGDNNGLQRTIREANEIFKNVKQTSDATLDSRLMVNISDLAYKKAAQLAFGDTSTGVDVDDFVSKCIAFMKRPVQEAAGGDDGEAPTSTARRRNRRQSRRDDEEEDDLDADQLDWAYLGSHACFPANIRPPVPGFLLGPLSVQKRVRAPTQRRARQRRDVDGEEKRPEALTRSDLETSSNNTVTVICNKLWEILDVHCKTGVAAIENMEDETDEEVAEAYQRYRITNMGGPNLFDFVINPHSFSQTVENMFYVSFLIREGKAGVEMDDDGLPSLLAVDREQAPEEEERRKKNKKDKGSNRHQAVFSIDYSTWQQLIQAFDIQEPLIPSRAEEQPNTQVGARGWYA